MDFKTLHLAFFALGTLAVLQNFAVLALREQNNATVNRQFFVKLKHHRVWETEKLGLLSCCGYDDSIVAA